ncbi:MAG TPA: HAD-IC family P-type ATPase, partial [Pyrinomonadaceae bacterium]
METSPDGLSSDEVAKRLEEYGPNELQARAHVSPWTILLEQFKNVLLIILLLATALSAFLGHGVEAIAITVFVLFAVILGFIQEFRAERAIEALREMAAPSATAIRDGQDQRVPARDLVPGDVIILSTGDKVPADARLIEAVNLQTVEAPLTGESAPVEKHTRPLPEETLPAGDQKNMAFAGTAVTYGRGRALIVATGMSTEFGKIARMLEEVDTAKTPLQKNLDRIGKSLARAAFAVVAVIVALGLFRGQPFVEMLIFGVALAVAVVPEALPAVVTISLALGVKRMVRRNALIRRLPAVETLGSTSVICSDKTGTLTKDEMTVRQLYVAGHTIEVSGTGYEPTGTFSTNGSGVVGSEALSTLLRAGVLASDARVEQKNGSGTWEVKGDPTEGALVVAAAKA